MTNETNLNAWEQNYKQKYAGHEKVLSPSE